MNITMKKAFLTLTICALAPIGAANAAGLHLPVGAAVVDQQTSANLVVEVGNKKKKVRRIIRRNKQLRRNLRQARRNGSFANGVLTFNNRTYKVNSAHVRWCIAKYRSYDIRSNTWVAYSGNINQCISPYL